MTTKFNDALHEDLLDLFIMNFAFDHMGYRFKKTVREKEFYLDRIHPFHFVLKDLFPQENMPEEYVRWVDETDYKFLRLGGGVFAFTDKEPSAHRKIKITVEKE